ncbi:MAG TPA: hypothetical protein V6D22_15005 [Candidatus Obscuribacterales bacterium]
MSVVPKACTYNDLAAAMAERLQQKAYIHDLSSALNEYFEAIDAKRTELLAECPPLSSYVSMHQAADACLLATIYHALAEVISELEGR